MFFLYVDNEAEPRHRSEDYTWLIHYACWVGCYKVFVIKDMDGHNVYSSEEFYARTVTGI